MCARVRACDDYVCAMRSQRQRTLPVGALLVHLQRCYCNSIYFVHYVDVVSRVACRAEELEDAQADWPGVLSAVVVTACCIVCCILPELSLRS